MKDSKDFSDWILREVAHINPYTSKNKSLAMLWATGFLARCCAEMMWRDTKNIEIFKRIRDRSK